MSNEGGATEKEVDILYERLLQDTKTSGYFLNRDVEFAKELVGSLIVNEGRYGYPACPCRLASGSREDDQDIVCPCDYRDADIAEFGACYCALYVSQASYEGKKVASIPERRPLPEERKKRRRPDDPGTIGALPLPVWRCKVCGYLCAREAPPDTCPICKVKKERFERFI